MHSIKFVRTSLFVKQNIRRSLACNVSAPLTSASHNGQNARAHSVSCVSSHTGDRLTPGSTQIGDGNTLPRWRPSADVFAMLTRLQPSQTLFTLQSTRYYSSSSGNTGTTSSSAERKSAAPSSDEKTYSSSPGEGIEIYRNSIRSRLRLLKGISLSTSVMGLACQPYLWSMVGTMPLASTIFVIGFTGFFTFVTYPTMHLFTRSLVSILDYHPDTNSYTAHMPTFFFTEKKITFKSEEIDVPDVPGPFTSIVVNGRPMFIDPNQFYPEHDPSWHYAELTGLHRPMDWCLNPVAAAVLQMETHKGDAPLAETDSHTGEKPASTTATETHTEKEPVAPAGTEKNKADIDVPPKRASTRN